MKRLFDPFIIIEAIQLTLKKYEPLFTFPFAKECFLYQNQTQAVNWNELISQNFSQEKSDFLNSLFDHLNHLIQNQTAERSDLLRIFGELLIELHPDDRHEMNLNETQETTRAVEILTQMYENWEPITNQPTNSSKPGMDNRGVDSSEGGDDSEDVPPEYSIQERTLKISFPKGDDEENTITKVQLSKILSSFGEISEVQSLSIHFSPHSFTLSPLSLFLAHRLVGKRSSVCCLTKIWRVS
jgi:hypothetical protein